MAGAQLDMEKLCSGPMPSRRELARIVVLLSLPTIIAELASMAMEYIDAAMVGSLGAEATAAVGLVASTTWLVWGICGGAAVGFSVQIAQFIGAGDQARARNVLRQGIVALTLFSLALTAATLAIAGPLPAWLGGDEAIRDDATAYFFMFSLAMPLGQISRLCINSLQCVGDMRTPSVLNVVMCLLDVAFNFVLIFPTRTVDLFGTSVVVPGAGWGVEGAAVGSALSELVVCVLLFWTTCWRSPELALWGGVARARGEEVARRETWRLDRACLVSAVQIATPVCFERVVMGASQVALTRIVAPLGTVSVAAHSLAVTAEAVCYMPGYGIGQAATALVGQSVGAGRKDFARHFARMTTAFGMAGMGAAAIVMFAAVPWVMELFTPNIKVQELAVQALRVGLLAEPLFGASIVAAGALRGAGDTLVPSIMNAATTWGIRITSAAFLAPRLGLVGVWGAMAGELCVRGAVFLVRLMRERWLDHGSVVGR